MLVVLIAREAAVCFLLIGVGRLTSSGVLLGRMQCKCEVLGSC